MSQRPEKKSFKKRIASVFAIRLRKSDLRVPQASSNDEEVESTSRITEVEADDISEAATNHSSKHDGALSKLKARIPSSLDMINNAVDAAEVADKVIQGVIVIPWAKALSGGVLQLLKAIQVSTEGPSEEVYH
jgi:hypothetical protein